MKSFLMILGFLFPLIASSQHAVPDFSHVPYSQGENNWLNIYLAEGEVKRPVLVFAHANGSTADQFPLRVWNDIKMLGVSAISWESVPNVRNLSEYQICQEDFLKVLDWIQNNSEKYGFDMDKIIIFGRSRGSVVFWSALHEYPEKFKGAYLVQALPNGAWSDNKQTRDYTRDVTPESPVLFFTYADGPDTDDGHTPLNGLRIKDAYDLNGIADRFRLEHSLGKQELYSYLTSFILEILN